MAKRNDLARNFILNNQYTIFETYKRTSSLQETIDMVGIPCCSTGLLSKVLKEILEERERISKEKTKKRIKNIESFIKKDVQCEPVLSEKQVLKFYSKIQTVYDWAESNGFNTEYVRLFLTGHRPDKEIELAIKKFIKD